MRYNFIPAFHFLKVLQGGGEAWWEGNLIRRICAFNFYRFFVCCRVSVPSQFVNIICLTFTSFVIWDHFPHVVLRVHPSWGANLWDGRVIIAEFVIQFFKVWCHLTRSYPAYIKQRLNFLDIFFWSLTFNRVVLKIPKFVS